jgi:hypothetical protein
MDRRASEAHFKVAELIPSGGAAIVLAGQVGQGRQWGGCLIRITLIGGNAETSKRRRLRASFLMRRFFVHGRESKAAV